MYPNAGINAAVAAARHPVSQIKIKLYICP